jgi:hypothetical protein
MVTLEQVKLLETKVVRAIDYVDRISRENSQLQGKLDSYQKRIEELEVLIQQFRDDQGRIEEGILAALERLNRFEDAIEKSFPGSPAPRPGPKAPSRPEEEKAEPEIPPEEEEPPLPGPEDPGDSPGDGGAGPEDPLSGMGPGGEDDFSGDSTGELDIF